MARTRSSQTGGNSRNKRPADDPPATPLPKRSRGAPAAQVFPCCARCARYIFDETAPADCDVTDIKKCARCSRGNKKCVPIHSTLIERFNALVARWRAAGDDDADEREACRDELRTLVRNHDQTVRVANRADLAGASPGLRRGGGGGDVLLLREIRLLREVMTQFLDSYRAVHHLAPLAPVGEDEEEDDDE